MDPKSEDNLMDLLKNCHLRYLFSKCLKPYIYVAHEINSYLATCHILFGGNTLHHLGHVFYDKKNMTNALCVMPNWMPNVLTILL